EQCRQYEKSFKPSNIQAGVNHFLVFLRLLTGLFPPNGPDKLATTLAPVKDNQDIDDQHDQNFFLERANSSYPEHKCLERWVNEEKDGAEDSEEMDYLIEYEGEGMIGQEMGPGQGKDRKSKR